SAAWYGLAYAAWQKQDLAGAQQALNQAQQNGRSSPELARLTIALAQAQGDSVEALSLAQSAWERWPRSQGVGLARVEAMQKAGQDSQAVTFLVQLIKQWPDVPRLHQLKAQSHERL